MEWLKYSRFLCGDENVLGVNSGDSYTPCKYTKNHWIVQFFIFLIFLGVGLFYNAELASAVQRRESAVCVPLLVGSAPRPGPRRALSGAPCAAREVLVSFLRDAEQRVCVCPPQSPSSSHPSFSSLLSSHLFSMSVSLLLLCKWVPLHHFSRVHIPVLVYDICFSLSDLFHSV